MRRLVCLAFLILSACGGGEATATVAPPTLDGVWSGATGALTFRLTLAQSTTGAVSGSGSMVSGTTTAAATATGTVTGSNFSLTISPSGFQPANYQGTFVAGQMAGVLNGSGLVNAAMTMSRSQ